MMPLETEFFECECHTPEHVVQFTFDPEDGELYMTVFLWKWAFWKRVWIAIKYVFGYTSKFGDFDGGASFKQEDLNRLSQLAQRASDRKVMLEKERQENGKR